MTAWIIFLLISIILYSFLKYWAIIPISSILLGIGLGYLANYRRTEKHNILNNQFSRLVLLDLAAKHQLKLGKLSADDYQTLKTEIEKFSLALSEELELTYKQQHQSQTQTKINSPIQSPIPIKTVSDNNQDLPELPEIQPESVKITVPEKPKKPLWNLLNILMPFIWQNIGWFIGGFCFVSGSIFLVSYTSGFYNALTIFLVLSLYSFGLFLGAYQIRRHRQELVTSSSVLFTLGILLVPLNFTAALRLIYSGMENGILLSFAILLSILAVSIFFIATRIAAGIMERSLQKEYPIFFIALASLQFTKPLLLLLPNYLSLIALHMILLAILGYALRRFTQHWLHSIFIEERKTAYYTAGTLVYAAIVSFILLTWNSGIELPNGYAGFFIMAICLLLLSVDVQFKQWVNKQALLSHFSFVIYALSILAILFSLPTFSILTLVLGMGAILYGLMVWQYLTVQPLYLFLASLSGLYWLFILQYFPLHWYFLLSLPGLSGIMLLHRFAEKRESAQLALVCCRVMIALATVLLVSSLYYAPPGEIALLTALLATIGILRNLYKPSPICKTDSKLKHFEPYKAYIATALATLTLAYMPLYFGIDWIYQFSIGLILLAILWAALGLLQRSKNTDFIITTEVLFNSGLLSLILSIILATLYTQEFLAWILIIVTSVLLWLSLKLRIRLLFYAMLLTLAAAGGLFKYYYFPTSSGRGLILLALGVWLLLWWFHYRLVYLNLNSPKSEKSETLSYTILWFFKVSQKSSIFKMLKLPLQQTMILLWLIGLWRIIEPVFLGNPTILNTSWGISAFLAALLTALIAGNTRILALLPLSIFLLLGTLFVINPLTDNWFPFIAATYALILWFFSLFLPKLPLTKLLAFFDWQGNYGSKGGRVQTEHWIYRSTFIIILLSVATALFSKTQVLLSVLGITAIFFWKSGLTYRIRLNIYLFISSISLAGLIIIMQLFPLVSEESLFFILSSAIIWANLLLILSWLTKRYLNDFSNPLFVFSFLLLGILLLGGINLFSVAIWVMKDNLWEYFVIFALLLNFSFVHVLILRPQSLSAHILLFSLLLTTLLLFLTLLGMPLLLNLWIIALLLFTYKNPKSIKELNKAIQKWIPISIIVSLFSLFLDIETSERLLNLALLSGLAFVFGFQNKHQKQAKVWMVSGVILFWILLHSLWIVWQPEAEFSSLLPWYALQNALLAIIILLLSSLMEFKALALDEPKAEALDSNIKWLTSLAAGIWLVHGINFATTLSEGRELHELFGNLDNVAVLITGILLILLWWRNAITETMLIYGIAIIIGILIIYIRLLWLGLEPLNVWDTAFLMSLGYILFSFHQFAPSKPLYSLTLLLPLLAILTIPLQLDSIYATTTLIAAATLYLLITPSSENKLPMYLGLLALNIGIYIWIPSWAENYKLIQVYTIPVAITVLIMLQFHQLELKPSVVNAIRLTALSSIYATATLDVFMRPELGIFILALSLSLGGIILGIALRIKAFLYLGTLFLIFNVFGQLIDFYPEERLSKAIVLMVLGGIITGGMIWFNMQGEVISLSEQKGQTFMLKIETRPALSLRFILNLTSHRRAFRWCKQGINFSRANKIIF